MGPLDYRGSQASLASKATATGKRGKKVSHYGPLRETLSIDHLCLSVCLSVCLSLCLSLPQTVRRQRVDFMSGQHQLAHFFKGKDTPTTDVLQVGYYLLEPIGSYNWAYISSLQDIYKLIRLSPQYHSVLALWIVSESLGKGERELALLSF